MEKKDFKKTWDSLIDNMQSLVEITEANRRLLSGLVTLLIDKEIMSVNEVNKIEKQVFHSIKNKK